MDDGIDDLLGASASLAGEPPQDPDASEAVQESPEQEPQAPLPVREKSKLEKWLSTRYFLAANALYHTLYYLGVSLLRKMLYWRRRIRAWWKAQRDWLGHHHDRRLRNIRISARMNWRELTAPVRELKMRYRRLRNDLENEKRYGTDRGVMSIKWKLICFFVKKIWQILRYILNYLAPIVACWVLFYNIQQYTQQDYALMLEYNGDQLGYIANESVFTQAQSEMKGRLINEAYIRPADITPSYELVDAQDKTLLTVDQLTDMLIQSSGNELQEAYGFYLETVRGSRSVMELVGAVEDGDALLEHLDFLLDRYIPDGADASTKAEFIKKIQLKPGLYPVSSIRDLGEIKALLSEEEKGEQRYTVVDGDTPLRIAAKNGISFDELKAMNPEVDVSLFPGDSLLVAQSVPKMQVRVIMLRKYEEELDYTIKQETVPTKDIGWTYIKQRGEMGEREVTERVVLIDGMETGETEVVNTRVIKEPVEQVMQVGGSRPLAVVPPTSSGKLPSGTFGWPASGGSISPGFRGYYGHTGSDISFSGCYGTPVFASADGIVTSARYSAYGYGYHIVVNHGGGIETMYAHCSRLDVAVGQQVSKGQQIALIGSTGNSTGPHVHFEVRIGGTPVDAAPYLYS